MERLACLIIGYIFGLFQTGYLYGKLKKVDVRNYGSGNAGTTNTMRVLGKKAGVITYIGDSFKALFAGAATYLIFDGSYHNMIFLLLLYTGLGVVLGHNFPFYMGFKGGKGIAASSGAIVALGDWKLILLAFLTFTLVTYFSKYVSLGSLCMMAGFFVEMIILGQMGQLFRFNGEFNIECYIITFLISGLAFYRHRANIGRLISGTERKIGQKKIGE